MVQAQGISSSLEVLTSRRRSNPAFKEWALVCASMLRGETSLIFRKGGVAEGRDGFRFQHDRFFLFPTFFHEQVQRLRVETAAVEPEPDLVTFSAYAQVEFTRWVQDLDLLAPFSDLHILKPEVLEQRFLYDEPKGLHLAMVRVFRVTPAWSLPFEKSFRGCRSWVELPESPTELHFTPVITDDEQAVRRERILASIGVVGDP
jgi:hypothetical protein